MDMYSRWKCLNLWVFMILCYVTVFCKNSEFANKRGYIKYCPEQVRVDNNIYRTIVLTDKNVKNAYKSFRRYLFNKTNVVWNGKDTLLDAAIENPSIKDVIDPPSYAIEMRLSVPLTKEDLSGKLTCCAIVSQNNGMIQLLPYEISRTVKQEGKSYIIKMWMCGKTIDTNLNYD